MIIISGKLRVSSPLAPFAVTVVPSMVKSTPAGMVTGCLPTKGLALPFISYGGTNLITAMIAVGTLINIALHIDRSDDSMHTQVAHNAVKTL